MDSIMHKEKECLFCHDTHNLHRHHIFYGTANRQMSEKHGCWCWLCADHHNMSDRSVHMNHDIDILVKMAAQSAFEKSHTKEEFRKIFGKSYL